MRGYFCCYMSGEKPSALLLQINVSTKYPLNGRPWRDGCGLRFNTTYLFFLAVVLLLKYTCMWSWKNMFDFLLPDMQGIEEITFSRNPHTCNSRGSCDP